MPSDRTPATIANEAAEHLASSNTAFVPANLVKLARLNVEFMLATAAAVEQLQAAAAPAPVATDTPAA